jgi:hypothetical protein
VFRDDAAADSGANLHEEEVLDPGTGDPVLSERHDVDVVVGQDSRLGWPAHGLPDR